MLCLRHSTHRSVTNGDGTTKLLDSVNVVGAQMLLRQNIKKSKLMSIGDVEADITIRVKYDPVEKERNFKYLGSLKSSDGDCSK